MTLTFEKLTEIRSKWLSKKVCKKNAVEAVLLLYKSAGLPEPSVIFAETQIDAIVSASDVGSFDEKGINTSAKDARRILRRVITDMQNNINATMDPPLHWGNNPNNERKNLRLGKVLKTLAEDIGESINANHTIGSSEDKSVFINPEYKADKRLSETVLRAILRTAHVSLESLPENPLYWLMHVYSWRSTACEFDFAKACCVSFDEQKYNDFTFICENLPVILPMKDTCIVVLAGNTVIEPVEE